MSFAFLTSAWPLQSIGELAVVLALPMGLGLRHGQAALTRWLLAPAICTVTALLLVTVGGLIGSPLTTALTGTARLAVDAAALVALLGAAYAAGRLLSRATPATQHVRGTRLAPGHVTGFTRARRKASGITLAGLPVPLLDETKHFKLIGTTGSGKSTAIREVLRTALHRGDRAIIADPDGGYLQRFYDPYRGDEILNPFEARTAQWSLYAEIQEPYDIEQLARSLIPDTSEGSGREWRAYARTFLSAVLKRSHERQEHDIGLLWHRLAVASAEELKPLVAGTPAQPFLESGNERMFGSIRSVTTAALSALDYLAQHPGLPLSVRGWVRGDGARSRVLFLPYSAAQIAALKSVIATWLRLAIFEAMNQPEGDQRLWFVIDELDALGAIDGLKDALARLRKFGGRCVLGFQSIGQVSALYGHGDAQTIVENCGNTVILRCSASEGGGTADFASRLIGQREVLRRHISDSTGRDLRLFNARRHRSRTVSAQPALEWAVLPAQIEQLPDLHGLVKLASGSAWHGVRLLTDPR